MVILVVFKAFVGVVAAVFIVVIVVVVIFWDEVEDGDVLLPALDGFGHLFETDQFLGWVRLECSQDVLRDLARELLEVLLDFRDRKALLTLIFHGGSVTAES